MTSIDITDSKIAKAFAHPLRIQILELLEGRVASPRQISDELGAALSNTSYHVRQLASSGLLELVDRRTRRGAVEHFYTTKFRPRITDTGWARLSRVAKPALIPGGLHKAMAQMAMAAEQGGFDRDDIHYSRTTENLDEETWAAVARELREPLKRIDQIVEGAAARMEDDPDRAVVESTIVLVQYANPAASEGPRWPSLDEVDTQLPALHPGTRSAESRAEMTSSIDITDPKIAKAYAHPLRIQILELLEGRVASPRQISDELGSKLSNTSYHMRQLASSGLVEMVDRRTRGGAVEHFYTTKFRPRITDTGWARVPDIAKRALITGGLQKVMAHMAVAAEQGGFDRDNIHYSRTANLDEEAWRVAAHELRELLKRIDLIVKGAAARMEDDPDRAVVESTIFLVQYANPAGSPEDPRWPPLDEVDERLPALREDAER
ncbi:MAG TPA: helix-turn-helix domain-containing protein [Thermoleophilaceae bacterium]|jgi:DNA-binding transcriptional ArsR family regulator